MREEPIVNGEQWIAAWTGLRIGKYRYKENGNIEITNSSGWPLGIYRVDTTNKPYTSTWDGSYVGEGNLLMGLLYEDIHKRNNSVEVEAIKHF